MHESALTHALRTGSERYPDEKEYKAYLSQHGGSSNASTGGLSWVGLGGRGQLVAHIRWKADSRKSYCLGWGF